MEKNRPPVRMHMLACCFLGYVLLQIGSAGSTECTASSSSLFSEETTYSISDDSRVTGSDWHYSWAKDNNVLANHDDVNPDLVVNRSINNLITRKCFDNITLTRDSISEGFRPKVYCQPNCTSLALMRSQKQREIPVTVVPAVGATVGAAVGAAVGATLLLGLLCVGLLYKFKDQISRKFNRIVPKCVYTAGKMQSSDPEAAVEEAGNA